MLLYSNNDDEEEGRPVTGLVHTGELLGEKPENMIPLPIIKQEDHQVRKDSNYMNSCVIILF